MLLGRDRHRNQWDRLPSIRIKVRGITVALALMSTAGTSHRKNSSSWQTRETQRKTYAYHRSQEVRRIQKSHQSHRRRKIMQIQTKSYSCKTVMMYGELLRLLALKSCRRIGSSSQLVLWRSLRPGQHEVTPTTKPVQLSGRVAPTEMVQDAQLLRASMWCSSMSIKHRLIRTCFIYRIRLYKMRLRPRELRLKNLALKLSLTNPTTRISSWKETMMTIPS